MGEMGGFKIMKIAYGEVGISGSVPLAKTIPAYFIRAACENLAAGDKLLYRRLLGLCQVARRQGCREIQFTAWGEKGKEFYKEGI